VTFNHDPSNRFHTRTPSPADARLIALAPDLAAWALQARDTLEGGRDGGLIFITGEVDDLLAAFDRLTEAKP
jgi:hypothetical protein